MAGVGALLSPVTLGPIEVPVRVVSTSHQTSLVQDHLPTADLVAYHEARARGGAGAVFLEATAVHPTGLLTDHTIAGWLPGIAERYRALADAVHAHGTRILVQLFHGGREQFGASPRAPAVAPSAVPSARFKSEPRALTARELGEIVAGYATAARRAREGGLDGIELSFSHGYLVAEFFSPQANRRDDAWGSDRLRLAREVIAAVRNAAGPELAVGIRLSADELGPGLLGAARCAEIGGALCSEGEIDFVSAVLGHSATYTASTWIAPPPPVDGNAIAGHLPTLRAAVAPVPVIATTRVVDLEAAASLVVSRATDLVGMTRALIADPELVAKARGAGTEPVIECIGCNQACIGHYHQGVPIACTVNPRTGREARVRRVAPRATQARRVLVAGGGPAGVAAAIEAARRGHVVELHEREARLGGQLALAAAAPAHREMYERWRRTTTAQLSHHGVVVRLGSEVDGLAEAWDACVLATGARPYRPPLPALDALDGLEITDAWRVIADPESVAGPVLIADWGGEWSGLDAAERLRAAGHEVTLACAATHPGESLHQYQRNLYLGRLHAAGIEILHHAELALEADAIALRHVFSGRPVAPGPCATLVVAHGRSPADELWPALEGRAGAVRAGDVLSPRSLEEAILEGTEALEGLGMPAGRGVRGY
jgi:2,4-dienoyl-CoA reductase-like NADH-dependent reductase (Old Yellow Enzyme family)